MRTTIGGRRSAATAVLVAVTLALAVVALSSGSPASASSATPVLRANPHMRLTNGESIQVHGGHFGADDVIDIVECERGASLPTLCAADTSTPVTANAQGHIALLKFTVRSGLVGTTTCGASATDARACELTANDVTKATEFVASVNIGFKPSPIVPAPTAPVTERALRSG